MARADVERLARAKWRSSGLTDAQARKLKLRALTAHQVSDLSPGFHEAGALCLPYFNLDGRPTRFFRVRYLQALPGAAGLVEKPQRYDQLPVMQEAYYPPLLDTSWREIADDPGKPVGITEGELKAACACAHGLPVMALGGVYSFMSQKRGIDLLPSMREFNWRNREVFVCYDNDVSVKVEVMQAQRMLTQRLLAEGAKVSYAPIPPGDAKGLDDYIVAHGFESFLKNVLGRSQPSGECEALWSLNEEVIFVKDINQVLEKRSGLLMEPSRFMQHQYGNRFHYEPVEKKSGDKKIQVLEKVKTAPKWVEWEHRAEVQRLTYEPGAERLTCAACAAGDTEHTNHDKRAWNAWNGWGVKPRRGSVEPWTWLLDFLFENDAKARKYFEQWCAYPIQHPGAKMFTAVLLWSRVKRLGKSLLGGALRQIYGENAALINSKQLKSSFNSWAKNKQLVIGEEITAGEARIDADYLKDLITSPIVTVNAKFKDEYVIPNHTNFIFFSNHPDALFLEDGDKRYMIHGIPHERPAPRAKYAEYVKWLDSGGAAHLMQHFLSMSMRGFHPSAHAPETTSKYQMIVAGKTDIGLWIMRLQEDPTGCLSPLGQKIAEGCDLLSPEELHEALDPEKRWRGMGVLASLGKHLVSAGYRMVNGEQPVQVYVKGGKLGLRRLYAVRNLMRWSQATRDEIKEHRELYFGPQQAGEVK